MHSKTTRREYPPRAPEHVTLIAKIHNPVCVLQPGACLYCRTSGGRRSARKNAASNPRLPAGSLLPEERNT